MVHLVLKEKRVQNVLVTGDIRVTKEDLDLVVRRESQLMAVGI